jgi:hypothetical protein
MCQCAAVQLVMGYEKNSQGRAVEAESGERLTPTHTLALGLGGAGARAPPTRHPHTHTTL